MFFFWSFDRRMNSASQALSLSDPSSSHGESLPPSGSFTSGTFPRPAWARPTEDPTPFHPLNKSSNHAQAHRPLGKTVSSTLPSSTAQRCPLRSIDEVDRGRNRVSSSVSCEAERSRGLGESREWQQSQGAISSNKSSGFGSNWGLTSKLLDFNFGSPNRSSVGDVPTDSNDATRKRQLRKTQSVEVTAAARGGDNCYSYGSSVSAFCEQLHSMHKEQLQQLHRHQQPVELKELTLLERVDSSPVEEGVEEGGEEAEVQGKGKSSRGSSSKDEYLGRIQFSVSYDFQDMTLTLKIFRAVDLPAKDLCGTSDPYVKILLLPDKRRKLTTNIKRKNLNPRWNEIFAFEGFPYNKLLTRTLYLQVIDYDRFSRDDPIGEVCVPLADLDLAAGLTLWKTLQPCKGHTGKLGDLNVGLCYQPTVGRVSVTIQSARQLKAKDINGLSDPYVKIWLLYDGKKIEKKKTAVKEKTLNPLFNESFVFDVPYERIRGTSISIQVMDHDRMGRNELIGQVLLGTKSGPQEVKHWNEMFARSRTSVSQWHVLKDFG